MMRPAKKIRKRKPFKGPIIVRNEKGEIVFRGMGRRGYGEQVFFDSATKQRRFMAKKDWTVSPAREEELKKLGEITTSFGRPSYIDQRNPKHTKRRLKQNGSNGNSAH